MPPRTHNKAELTPGAESPNAHRTNKTLASLTVPFRKFFRPTSKPQHQSKKTNYAESEEQETQSDGNPCESPHITSRSQFNIEMIELASSATLPEPLAGKSRDEYPSSASIPALGQQSPNLPTGTRVSTTKQLSSQLQVTGQTVVSTFQGAHDFSISGNPQFINIGKQKMVNVYGGGTYGTFVSAV